MQTQTHTIHINASPEKVLTTMLDKEAYKIWTIPFNPEGSYYEGEMKEGSKIHFLGADPEETSKVGGMLSYIDSYIPNQYISFSHMGLIVNGEEDTESEEAKKWKGSYENYTVHEKDGGTELVVEAKVTDEYASYMQEAWVKALESLKKLVETV